jgi:hypothetical protein
MCASCSAAADTSAAAIARAACSLPCSASIEAVKADWCSRAAFSCLRQNHPELSSALHRQREAQMRSS